MCDDAAAPMVLYDIVCAALPLKVVPDAAPAPPLLNVRLLAVVTVVHVPSPLRNVVVSGVPVPRALSSSVSDEESR